MHPRFRVAPVSRSHRGMVRRRRRERFDGEVRDVGLALRCAARVGTLAAVSFVLGACAHYGEVALGEALTVGDSRRAAALSLEVAEGSGSSNDSGSTFTETRGRVLVGVERQQLGGLFGVSRIHWIADRTPVWGHIAVGAGLEHLSLRGGHTFFFEAIAQARLGTAFILGESSEPLPELSPWQVDNWDGRVRDPAIVVPTTKRVLRKRVLLTLAVVGDVDARFTRSPLYVASLMFGLAFLEEPRPLPRIALPPLW